MFSPSTTAIATLLAVLPAAHAVGGGPHTQPSTTSAAPRLIIRIDDIGFCHGANAAAERILERGLCTSASVIVNTPWLDEAVAILQRHPEVSVGVHLTLNAEWREYRWGPVLPYSEVPSLVDQDGRFFPSQQKFLANQPNAAEVEKELRAQIELARRKGLPVTYIDCHMGTAVCTPEFRNVVEKLAAEYKLALSGYFGEIDTPSIYDIAPEGKLAAAIRAVEQATEPGPYLLVVHPGTNAPEMAAMTDLNPTRALPMAAHRQAEADVLCNPAFRAAVERGGVTLIGYRELRAEGLDRMKRPQLADQYGHKAQPSTRASPAGP